jgi:hypothetical protein
MTMPVAGMLQDLAPPAAVLARVEALAEDEAQGLEHADHAWEEPPRASESMVVVVRPAEAEPVLTLLLDPGGTVARLPVFALGLEDEVTRQVGPPARSITRASVVSVASIPSASVSYRRPTPLPDLARGQGVARRMRLHRPPRASSPGNGSNPR